VKRSEQLVRKEIDDSIMIVARDSLENFNLVTKTIKTISDEEIEPYDVSRLRAAGAALIQTIEELVAAISEDSEWSMPPAEVRDDMFQSMREELASA
jgi:cytochrome c556